MWLFRLQAKVVAADSFLPLLSTIDGTKVVKFQSSQLPAVFGSIYGGRTQLISGVFCQEQFYRYLLALHAMELNYGLAAPAPHNGQMH